MQPLKHLANDIVLALVLFSVYLAYEHFFNPSSFWKPYLSSLPPSFKNILPFEWSDTDIDILKGTPIYHMIKDRIKLINDTVELIRDVLKCYPLPYGEQWNVEFSQVAWACGVISSRAFPRKNEENDTTELCLYPVLDMVLCLN
jgi:hypothetical protein